MESEHQVPIWFFVGFLLLIYGLLIFGAGIYALQVPDGRANQLEGILAGGPLVLPARRHLVGRGDGAWSGPDIAIASIPGGPARRSRAGLTTDHLRTTAVIRKSIHSMRLPLFRHLARLDRSSYNCFEIERSMAFHWLFLISVAAGFVGAMSGMGGGVVLIPALTLLGMGIQQAIAISIVSVIATSSGSASAYVRDRITNLKVGMFLEMFTILGAMVGAMITLVSGQPLLFIVFGLVLLLSWLALFLERHETWRPAVHQDRFSRWLELEGSYYDQAARKTIQYRAIRAYLGGPLMFVAGLVSGMLGIGAGALKVLIHDLVMGLPPKVSTTTSNLIIGVTALAGTSVYLAAGAIDPGLVAPVMLGILLGAYLGTKVLVRLSNQAVRKLFLVVLCSWASKCWFAGFEA